MTQILPFKSIPLRLDIVNERLLLGQQEIPLTPKGFALLHYLVTHRDNLVTKQTLLDHVWPGVYVVEEALRYQIKELRIALGDNAQTPQFIETVRGRGYRFIGSITIIGPSHVGQSVTTSQSQVLSLTIPPGRAVDIATLQQWLTQAETGKRRLGFISGEPGIGKTTLLNAFLDGLHDQPEVYWLGCGRCVEFYGLNEAYLPLLDALEQLCRGEQGDLVISELDRYAPSWLLQLPEFVTDRASLERRVQGSGRERMLREFAQLLEALSQHKTLVLSLEDLHWADNATLEQLAYLAQRTQTAKLLIIGSYRPVDAYTSNQALVKLLPELSRYPHCNEHPLDLLNEAAVCDFIHRYYPGLSNEFAKLLQRRSGGNPLFMHNIIDYLQAHDWIVRDNGQWQFRGDMSALELELPVAIRQLIERRLSQLDDEEQTLLKTASAAGFTFASEALAVGLNWRPEEVEHRCEQLVQRAQFLSHSGEEHWPDGSVTARYEFIHALYQETLYKRLTPTSRTKLHQRIGERIEQGYDNRTDLVAAELAQHFERSYDYERAVKYFTQAAEHANQVNAFKEAIDYIETAFSLLTGFRDYKKRTRKEIFLLNMLAGVLICDSGYENPKVEKAFVRALELCRELEEVDPLFTTLRSSYPLYVGGGTTEGCPKNNR